MSKYADIIDHEYRGAQHRKPMPLDARAAQFAPFAALAGYDKALAETARQTSPKLDLPQEEHERIFQRLSLALSRLSEEDVLTITYFVPDPLKEGGEYVVSKAHIKKYDEYERILTMSDGSTIPIDEILSVEDNMPEEWL